MVRNKRLSVLFSNDEYENLKRKAKNLGLSVSGYSRIILMGANLEFSENMSVKNDRGKKKSV